MRRPAPSLCLVPLLFIATGCEDSPKQVLQGRWVGERVENFHPTQHAGADGWARGTSFDFRGSRVTVSIPAESPRKGTFKIAEASPDELVIDFLRSTGARDSATFRVDGDRMHWVLGQGRSVVLRKVVD